jgi:hypothetical protein
MTILGDKLQAALDNAQPESINTFVWKGPKVNGEQKEIKLVDATYEELRKWYLHCQEMLYNTNSKNPGRITLLGIIQKQIESCRAELLVRWLGAEKKYTRSKCLEDLRNIINQNKDQVDAETIKNYPISTVMDGLPAEYSNVTIKTVMNACLDLLGTVDTSHITLNFILRMGLWFTPQEMQKDLYRKDPETGKAMDRLEVVASELRLDLKPYQKLYVNDTGLSYNEFKTIYMLRRDKYSNLDTDLLKLLEGKVLYRFQEQCEKQAQQWSDKANEIIQVAEFKGWDITRNVNL